MVLVEVDAVVVGTTSVTATGLMAALLSDTTIALVRVTAVVAGLAESGRHCNDSIKYRNCYFFSVGKKRCHESGRGNAGGAHHHRINFDKYHPGYFGKLGMRHYHKTANMHWKPTINLNQLAALIPADQRAAAKKGKALPVVDLLSHGYAKLLGNGLATACIVKARYVSEKAERKLKKIGGAVVLQA